MAGYEKVTIGFAGGQVLATRVAARRSSALDRRSAAGRGWHELACEDGDRAARSRPGRLRARRLRRAARRLRRLSCSARPCRRSTSSCCAARARSGTTRPASAPSRASRRSGEHAGDLAGARRRRVARRRGASAAALARGDADGRRRLRAEHGAEVRRAPAAAAAGGPAAARRARRRSWASPAPTRRAAFARRAPIRGSARRALPLYALAGVAGASRLLPRRPLPLRRASPARCSGQRDRRAARR